MHYSLGAAPEVQRPQRRQPLQRPRHSRPALVPKAITTAAGKKLQNEEHRFYGGRTCGEKREGCVTGKMETETRKARKHSKLGHADGTGTWQEGKDMVPHSL